MSPLEVIQSKRLHIARLANQRGAAGEQSALADMEHWLPRPKGVGMRNLLEALALVGKSIKASSFDAIHIPGYAALDFTNASLVKSVLPRMTFIEIKSASQDRVKPGFGGFFFALTESEITAADVLGDQHRVALYNKNSGEVFLSSVSEILSRAKSSTWQLSVQL